MKALRIKVSGALFISSRNLEVEGVVFETLGLTKEIVARTEERVWGKWRALHLRRRSKLFQSLGKISSRGFNEA